MCTSQDHHELMNSLEWIERYLKASICENAIDETVQISSTMFWSVDYHERKHIFIWLPTSTALSLEDYGSITPAATTWLNLAIPSGIRVFATSQTSNTIPIMLRFTDFIVP